MARRKVCMFCGATLSAGNRAKEHIIPQWLQDHLGIAGDELAPTHYTFSDPDNPRAGMLVVSRRAHPLNNLLAGHVCAGCNNGWMSQLETEVAPTLVDLVSSRREVHQLDERERFVVARWAVKTVFALNRGTNYHQVIADELAHMIRIEPNALPPLISVVGQHHDEPESRFNWMQNQTWAAQTGRSQAEIRTLLKSSLKTSLQLGRLLLLVSYWPHEGWLYIYEKGIHVPLYPIRGPVMWLEGPDDFPWGNATDALIDLSFRMMIAERPVA